MITQSTKTDLEKRLKEDLSSVSFNFHDLMWYRIHEILIVSSPYDAYILEEDGRLSEQILHEYLGINLRYAPRVWRASTAAEAMAMLRQRKINLVISMMRMSDMDPVSFGRQVKEEYPDMPVVLLTYDTAQLKQLPDPIPPDAFDKVFIWTGNAKVLMAIIKYIEDQRNVDTDIRKADVRAIIVVEDDPYYYSIILPLIYSEIYYHTRNLLDKSLNDTHRLLRMRGRPKIILTSTYEEVQEYFNAYRENILGIISDTRFPRNGSLDDQAGFKLAKWIREIDPHMPMMLQSTNKENEEKAAQVNAHFLHKKSQTLLWDLREFLLKNFGFGDFIFRLESGKDIARASDLIEFEEAIRTIPEESFFYHANRNHFSNWLAARGEFQLASVLRPVQISDFDSTEEMREYLIEAIDRTRHVQQQGRIVEFSERSYDPSATVTHIRSGSLGGKARGLAFADIMLAESDIHEQFQDIRIRIPKIAVIGTDEFDSFMERNHLWEAALNASTNEEVKQLFYGSKLSQDLLESLEFFLEKNHYPLSVRSSSLFEDSQFQSLAGLYSTYYLPNCHDSLAKRLHQLCEAIRMVYASLFFQAPKSFLQSSIHRPEEEKMAVVLQELAGQMYGENRYYPTFSGLAQSINYYPVSHLTRDDGIAYVALGLGKTVVEMEKSLRFCPKYPNILPQFYSPNATMENSQHQFYAMNMVCDEEILTSGEAVNIGKYDLATAEKDGSLKWVGSVLNPEDNILRDSLRYEGPRVVTFSPLLKWKTLPLAELLDKLLQLGEHSLGCPVEMEFAGNIYDDPEKPPEFYLLQIRPMAVNKYPMQIDTMSFKEDQIFCRSDKTLGHGIFNTIQDIVFVKPQEFDAAKTVQMAREVGRMNENFSDDRPYLLIGPGRWGSADHWLGIPVEWNQISHVKVIVEHNIPGYNIEPSFGGHFFQNIASLRIGYLMVDQSRESEFIDWNWLDEQHVVEETEFLKWITLEHPIRVQIDSNSGEAVCLKPQPPEPRPMKEHEASGI